MSASALLIKRQLASVIKRFKFEELEGAVMPVFPEISWNRVRSKLVKNHKNFTVANVVLVIEEALDVRLASYNRFSIWKIYPVYSIYWSFKTLELVILFS